MSDFTIYDLGAILYKAEKEDLWFKYKKEYYTHAEFRTLTRDFKRDPNSGIYENFKRSDFKVFDPIEEMQSIRDILDIQENKFTEYCQKVARYYKEKKG